MDLKEIKKIANFARRAGARSISVNGLSIEFKDEIIVQRTRAPKLSSVKDEKPMRAPDPLPTLDDINQYIYGQNEEAG